MNIKRIRSPWALYRLFCGFLMPSILFGAISVSSAQDQDASTLNAANGIRIVTDQAIVDSKARYTEFSGNVQLTINDTQIAADWIKVTYNADIKNISNMAIDEKTIETISAKGNVKIRMNDMVANTKEAVYTSSNDMFILTGENTTISSGNDTIVCDKVTLNMKDETFKAESTGKTPVEAIFYNKTENTKE